MTKGSFGGATSHPNFRYTVEWEAQAVPAENYTALTATLYLAASFAVTDTLTLCLSVAGTEQHRHALATLNGTPRKFCEIRTVVTHEKDGKGTALIAADARIGQYAFSFSHELALATIDRASDLVSVTSAEIGGDCEVRWRTNHPDFSHRLTVCVGNVCTTASLVPTIEGGGYAQMALPLSLAAGLPDAAVGTGVATLITEYEGEQVGTAKRLEFPVTIPESDALLPTVTLHTAPVFDGDEVFRGLYLQGKTPIQATLDASAAYGATVVHGEVTLEGVSYAAPYLTHAPADAGEIVLTASVTDSRGMKKSVSRTVRVLPYTPPRLLPITGESAPAVHRETGTDGAKSALAVRVLPGCSPVTVDGIARNACTLSCRVREASVSAFDDPVALPFTGAFAGVVPGVYVRPERSYAVELCVCDTVGERTTLTLMLPTEEVTFHLREGGMGAAFGKHAEGERMLEIASDWTLRLHGTLDDSVTLSDVAAIDEASPHIRVCVRGGRRVIVDFDAAVSFSGTPITLATGLIPATLCPARDVYAVCVGEGPSLLLCSVSKNGDLILAHVHPLTGEKTTPFTVQWVDGHIEYER